ncbi:MFS transporter [Pelagimonas varians]|uniref:Inner membrane protein YbjJ n=1 Tax=Pelagimonas varians TaxID=696760 RepID=A0A238KUN5_9RHOB|nr:MFS transporter [Pelagimonas varians]PYG28353.1 putative MFS family arabinose efflux permease [Pelagimonas varians]SMX46564.1 Inner membrane protein YbjJ [Pelagimonas varians]
MLRDIYISRGPLAAFAAEGLFWGSFASLVPVIKSRVGLSDGEFGMVMLIAALGAVCAMWLAPKAEQMLGRWTLPVLSLCMATAFLFPGHADTGAFLALAMMAATISSGSLDVAMNARISVLEGTSGRPLMNLAHGIFSVFYALAALAGGFGREAGWTPAMIFSALSAICMLLIVQMILAPVPDPVRGDDDPEPKNLSWTLLLPAGMIVLLGFMSEQATEGWSALHLERGLGAGAAQGALGPAILGMTMAVGRLSGQVIVHYWSEAVVIRAATVLAAIGSAIAAWAPNLAVAYIGFGLLGMGVSVVAPMAFAWVGRMVSPEKKALAISRIAVLGYAGFFVGPPLMGFLAEWFGLPVSFTAISLLLLLVPLVLVPMVSRYRP